MYFETMKGQRRLGGLSPSLGPHEQGVIVYTWKGTTELYFNWTIRQGQLLACKMCGAAGREGKVKKVKSVSEKKRKKGLGKDGG